MVGAEIELPSGAKIRPVTVSDGPRGNNEFNPNDPNDFWGWEPLPGFANRDTTTVAMSHQFRSWPESWPDRETDPQDPGWPGQWNGFFGKDQFNADQESYWWMDDSRDREFILRPEPFYPDSMDSGDSTRAGSRGGLGLLSSVRGLQWSQTLAQNTIFWLYEVTNVGTTNYDKTVFGMIVGTTIGGDGDTDDDNSKFNAEEDLTFSWDNDNIGNTGWSPVGYLGYAFLESPGNRLNGIDDDGDGEAGAGDEIDEALLAEKIIQTGDPIVLIDYNTPIFERTVSNLPAEGVTIVYNGKSFQVNPGDTLFELPANNIDDNLNGLIDENTEVVDGIDNNFNGLIDEPNPQIGSKYANYFTGNGLSNDMLDEGRDDGIDNDNDWNVNSDDVGLDGKPGTNDEGEEDGMPTSGFRVDPITGESIDTGLPGEPNIDKTDVDESDQIGLTSFFFFAPFNVVKLNNDGQLWNTLRPGFFNEGQQNKDGDFIYGTGYFPLRAKQTERISLAFFFADDSSGIFKAKNIVQLIYNNDYNFAKAPVLPTVKGVVEDRKVTLYWDSKAEESFDRLTEEVTGDGFDFEGYKIYRATFPTWDESGTVTNVWGTRVADVSIAQFDLVNQDSGFFPAIDPQLGSVFYLGDNTDLVHTFTDTTVKNGFTYFYAVTAYDHGIYRPDLNQILLPAETSKFAAVNQDGSVELGQNVVQVRPEAPVAGYIPGLIEDLEHFQGDGSGEVFPVVIDPLKLKDGHEYELTYNDDGEFVASTTDFTIVNFTTGDTLVEENPKLDIDATVFEGINLHIFNGGFKRGDKYITTTIPFGAVWEDTTRNVLPVAVWNIFQDGFNIGKRYPANYQAEVGDLGVDTTAGFGPPKVPTNFRIKNLSEDRYIKFDMIERGPRNSTGFDPEPPESIGKIDENDITILYELDGTMPNFTYQFTMDEDSLAENPQVGDILALPVDKPYLHYDVFRFNAKAPQQDKETAKNELDKIKVVPNPYVATAIWEPRNSFTTGRGERSIHFIHLPQQCTVRIFNVRGELVATIEHSSALTDGTADWDLLSRDNLEVAYGVYIYHVDAPGIGQTTGKFAVIK
jgi:hypothetical protein